MLQTSSFWALGTASSTTRQPITPAAITPMRPHVAPSGMKTKAESATIASIMPMAQAFWAVVIPPRRW